MTAIAEVGLGGRLDATNALDTDLAIDHEDRAGPPPDSGRTLAEIAGEKVAIARAGQEVLSVVQRRRRGGGRQAYCGRSARAFGW